MQRSYREHIESCPLSIPAQKITTLYTVDRARSHGPKYAEVCHDKNTRLRPTSSTIRVNTVVPRFPPNPSSPRGIKHVQAEAGEWALLLGFARHLFASGQLDPPATLPSVPRIRVAVPANTTTLSAALSRPRTDDESPSTPLSHEVSERNSKPYSKAGCSELGGAGATRGLR